MKEIPENAVNHVAVCGAEDVNARVTYYYDTHPFSTTFVGQYTERRLAPISYGAVKEFYSYTRGGGW
jgi:hypothetical protein